MVFIFFKLLILGTNIFYVFSENFDVINKYKNIISQSDEIRVFHGDSKAKIYSNITFLFPNLQAKRFSNIKNCHESETFHVENLHALIYKKFDIRKDVENFENSRSRRQVVMGGILAGWMGYELGKVEK